EHGAQEEAVAYPAACRWLARPRLQADERPDEPRRGERLARRTEERREREPAACRFTADHRPGALRAQHLREALTQTAYRPRRHHPPPVVLEPEAGFPAGGCGTGQEGGDGANLRGGGAEEIAPAGRGGQQSAPL